MTEDVRTVPSSATVVQAADLMAAQRIRHLAVFDDGALSGVVSSRDLDRPAPKGGGRRVSDVMTREVVTVTASTPLRRAANLMRGRSIGSVIVTSGRKVVGIVTVSDLLDLVGGGKVKPIAQGKRWTLKHRTKHTHKAGATGTW